MPWNRSVVVMVLSGLLLLSGTSAGWASPGSPFTGRPLLTINTSASGAVRDATARGDVGSATSLGVLASRAQALWITGGQRASVELLADAAAAQRTGRVLVTVLYALPHRDCGGASAGGESATSYRSLVSSIAAPLGHARAVVVLEPDALALVDCLSPAAATERYLLLREATGGLTRAGATVYLDAGHAHWVPAATMTTRLRLSGIGAARGIALNVSGYDTTADNITYAKAIAARIPGLHAVVDTSRNGLGPTRDHQWCNAAGRALGEPPHAVTQPVLDALLWIKHPGESDGSCGRAEPSAGTFWTGYAVALVRRTAWANAR